MPSINLAPGTQYLITARKRRVRLYAISCIVAGIFFLGWLGLYTYLSIQKSTSADLKAKIESANQRIQDLHDESVRVALFEERLSGVSQLLDNHQSWDAIFAEIERLLPADAVLTSLSTSNDDSRITLEGNTQNVDQIAITLASLTNGPNHSSIFKDGAVKSILRKDLKTAEGASSIVYGFTMTLDLNKADLNQTKL